MIVALLIILFGVSFLVANLGYLPAEVFRLAWPSIIIAIGLVKLFSGRCSCQMHCRRLADAALILPELHLQTDAR